MKYKEAELTINKLVLDFLAQTQANEDFLKDLNEKDVKKVHKAIEKTTKRFEKFQDTLIRQLVKTD